MLAISLVISRDSGKSENVGVEHQGKNDHQEESDEACALPLAGQFGIIELARLFAFLAPNAQRPHKFGNREKEHDGEQCAPTEKPYILSDHSNSPDCH